MIRTRKIARSPIPMPRAWRRAAGRMDEALQKNAPTDYSEQIEMLGRQLFGHLWRHRNPSSNSNNS